MSLNLKNNVSFELGAGMLSGTALLVVKGGKEALLPATPFRLTVTKFSALGVVVYREVMLATNLAANVLTVTRAYEYVPDNDSATELTATAHDFDEGDMAYVGVTAGMLTAMDADIASRLPKAGGSMTGVLQLSKGSNIASASTVDLGIATGNLVHITGTTGISSFGTTAQAGAVFSVVFDGILTLTHNATSFVLPGGANVTTAAGDSVTAVCEGSGNWTLRDYVKADGTAVVANTNIHTSTEKTTITAADEFLIWDSVSLANRKVKHSTVFPKFWTGVDGSASLSSGTTTLTRDMHYTTLTLSGTAILNPNGYKIYCSVAFNNTSASAKVQRNGNAGTAGGNATAGGPWGAGTGGAALNSGSLNAEVGGANWGAGAASGAGNVGGTGTSANPAYTTTNGAGGGVSGNIGGATAGGPGGTSTRGTLYNVIYGVEYALAHFLSPASYVAPSTLQYKGSSGAGGGGGGYGPGSGSYPGGGGGGGGNGGMIWIAARTFNNASGAIEAIGGNGGNGGTGYSGSGNGGGGGGGGNGGVFVLIYETLTALGTVTLTGGTKGSGGATTIPGAAGTDGNAGTTIQIQITT